MTRVLLDTSILVRLANPTDTEYALAVHAVDVLRRGGSRLSITPQVIIEFRAVATRPKPNNGLAYTPQEAEKLVTGFEAEFSMLDDTATVYEHWKRIVTALDIVGKTVHDARVVAVCHVHGVTDILTFNLSHYRTLAAAPPGLVVLDPATV